MKTVHIILNAHLDPVWLWSWREGVDEVLNTAYYICDLLDRNPDIIYTRGEAWVYEKILQIDPGLFARIRGHVEAGRWSLVGGWYLQPDCNQPSGFAMERQIELGREFFEQTFGCFPKVAYNVDSFGHAAALPGLMNRAGQPYYVMMRPQENEMTLPARIFRWKGYAEDEEVITFRIAGCYCTPEGLTRQHIEASLIDLPDGVTDTMCYVGIGDHGGGPTEAMIQWCRDNRDSIPGVRLEFSNPERFFRKIESDRAKLPLFRGELQHHAVGCYAIQRSLKTRLRQAEHRLVQAELILEVAGDGSEANREALRQAWKAVCFNHFHDTLGGTCLPSAYADADAQLGLALTIADETAALSLRRHLIQLAPDSSQRMVFFNASEGAFDDYVEVEPWLEWTPWNSSWGVVDEEGEGVDFQVLEPESAAANQARLLFRLQADPRQTRVLRIVDGVSSPYTVGMFETHENRLLMQNGPAIDLGEKRSMSFPGAASFPLPNLVSLVDRTDTWAHGVDRFARDEFDCEQWLSPETLEEGPLRGTLFQQGGIGDSMLAAEWRLFRDADWIECVLRVNWRGQHRVLKLDWNLPGRIIERRDGVMGGCLPRRPDGRELPLRDWTLLNMEQAGRRVDVAIVAPDVYALDVVSDRVSLTLLRGTVMACHEPNPGTHARRVFSDHGEQKFRFRFLAAPSIVPDELEAIALALNRPPLSAELTRGMRNRSLRARYEPAARGVMLPQVLSPGQSC
jgi:alpha-mannosidase